MSQEKIFEALNSDSGVYFTGTLVERRQTPFQLIEVWDTPEMGRIFRLDGFNMTSERDEFFYHENLVHPALCALANPRAALIIGGGDGGSAEEILKHPSIEICELVELDGEVIELAKQHFGKVHGGVFSDRRLAVTVGDGLAYLKAPPRSYDLIVLDLTDPVGAAEALYSPSFFNDCKGALAPGGAMVMHLGSPVSHPARVRKCMDNLMRIFATAQPYFAHIPLYGSVWGFAVASEALDVRSVRPELVEARLAERGVGARSYYNGEIHRALFALPEYVKRLLGPDESSGAGI